MRQGTEQIKTHTLPSHAPSPSPPLPPPPPVPLAAEGAGERAGRRPRLVWEIMRARSSCGWFLWGWDRVRARRRECAVVRLFCSPTPPTHARARPRFSLSLHLAVHTSLRALPERRGRRGRQCGGRGREKNKRGPTRGGPLCTHAGALPPPLLLPPALPSRVVDDARVWGAGWGGAEGDAPALERDARWVGCGAPALPSRTSMSCGGSGITKKGRLYGSVGGGMALCVGWEVVGGGGVTKKRPTKSATRTKLHPFFP